MLQDKPAAAGHSFGGPSFVSAPAQETWVFLEAEACAAVPLQQLLGLIRQILPAGAANLPCWLQFVHAGMADIISGSVCDLSATFWKLPAPGGCLHSPRFFLAQESPGMQPQAASPTLHQNGPCTRAGRLGEWPSCCIETQLHCLVTFCTFLGFEKCLKLTSVKPVRLGQCSVKYSFERSLFYKSIWVFVCFLRC